MALDRHLRIAANHVYPFFYMGYNYTTHRWIEPHGIENDMINTLALYLNFSYSLIECGQIWGSRWPNGSYQGVLGEVESGRADLAAGEISVTYERSLAFDFSTEYAVESITFITKRQSSSLSSSLTDVMIKPFSLSVWLALLLSTISIAGILLTLTSSRPRSANSPSKIVMAVYGSILGEKLDVAVAPIDGRAMLISSLTICLWVVSTRFLRDAYCAELDSWLILLPSFGLNSLAELVEAIHRQSIKPCTPESSHLAALWDQAAASESGIMGLLGRTYAACHDPDTCLHEVKSRPDSQVQLAFFSESNFLLSGAIKHGIHHFHMPNPQQSALLSDRIAFVFPKGSLIKRLFDQSILRLLAGGLLVAWKTAAYRRIGLFDFNGDSIDSNPSVDSASSHRHLSMTHYEGLFYLYGLLLAISCLAFMLEFCKNCGKRAAREEPIYRGGINRRPGPQVLLIRINDRPFHNRPIAFRF